MYLSSFVTLFLFRNFWSTEFGQQLSKRAIECLFSPWPVLLASTEMFWIWISNAIFECLLAWFKGREICVGNLLQTHISYGQHFPSWKKDWFEHTLVPILSPTTAASAFMELIEIFEETNHRIRDWTTAVLFIYARILQRIFCTKMIASPWFASEIPYDTWSVQ